MGQIKNIKLHIVTDIKIRYLTPPHDHHGKRSHLSASVWTQEDSNSCGLLQTWQWTHQGKRSSPGPGRTSDVADEGSGACDDHRQGEVFSHRHPCECQGGWTGGTDVCYKTSHLQGHCCVLPEVCGRGLEEGDQGPSCAVRSFTLGC